MPDYDFSQVEAVLIDPQLNSMRVFRDVLVRLGIKRISTIPISELKNSPIDLGTADLLIADADTIDSDTVKLVRSIRNEPGISNPFVCTIVTTWQPTTALLSRVTNSGSDDLLVKPASQRQIHDRILALVENRKKFVVTADFTGPDRRKSAREGAPMAALEVPNTLRLKVTGQYTKNSARDLIAFGAAKINELKLVRGSIQAAFLVEFALPGLVKSPPDRSALDHLSRVPAVTEDLCRRFSTQEVEKGMGEVGKALINMVATVRAGSPPRRPGEADLARLRQLARQQMQEISPGRTLESLVKEVDDAVAGYRAKLAELLAAKSAEAAARATQPEPGSGAQVPGTAKS